MTETTPTTSGPVVRDTRYQGRIIRLNKLLYIREDTGPNLEEAQLCYDDGEPDTFSLANFHSLKAAAMFVQIWDATHEEKSHVQSP